MKRGAKTGLWILVAIAVVAVFAWTAMRRLAPQEVESIAGVQATKGVPVDYVVVPAVDLEDWREFIGTVEGVEQVDLHADLRTRIDDVRVAVGDEVRAGDVLVSLDDYDPARAGLNFETMRTRYETARADSARMEQLYASGAISAQELEHVRTQNAAARAAYLSARRAVELDTPISGIVTAVDAEPGEIAASGQSLVTVAAYDRIRVSLDVSAAERERISAGQRVRVAVPGAGAAEFAYQYGEVVSAALSADAETRLFRVEVRIENRGHRLRPGMLVTPEIRVAVAPGAAAVPELALLVVDGESRVYIVGDGDDDGGEAWRAVARPVAPGISNGTLVAIPAGLAVGERVVVWGHENLRDGMRLRLNRDRTAAYYPATR